MLLPERAISGARATLIPNACRQRARERPQEGGKAEFSAGNCEIQPQKVAPQTPIGPLSVRLFDEGLKNRWFAVLKHWIFYNLRGY
jgi:hypothetical protein